MNNVNLFWSNNINGKSYSDWINSKAVFSPHHALALLSHTKKNAVNLITYHKQTQIKADNITVIDADNYLNNNFAYASLLSNNNIAFISDYVRIQSSLENCGIVLDMDAVSINDFPDVDGFMATLPAKKTSSMAIKFGKTRPIIKVHDKSWDGKALSSFPTKPSPKSKELFNALLNKIKYYLQVQNTKNVNWNFVMHGLQEITARCDDMMAFPPITFGCIPAWKKAGNCYSLDSVKIFNGKTEKFGYRIPSITEIFKESCVVQHFYESAFKKADINYSPYFWKKLDSQTFLAHEAEHVIGQNWRSILTDFYQHINE